MVILEKDDKILLIRRATTGWRDGEYSLPAGHVEPNETFLETCVHEIKEEVCVDVKPEDLELIHIMQRGDQDADYVDCYFLAKKWSGTPAIGEPHKHDELKWVPKSELKNYLMDLGVMALDHAEAGRIYSHHGI